MPTECNATLFEFEAVERRAVVAGFDGGDITSNAGALLLGQVERGLGLMRRFGDASPTGATRALSSTRWRRWSGSGSSAWRWATRT